jgi:hypothetical protein
MDKFSKVLLQDTTLLQKVVQDAETLSQVCNLFGYSNHGRNTKKLRSILENLNIDYSHFREGVSKRIYEYTKVCPNCTKEFTVLSNRDGNKKITCSHNCANKFFAWKQGAKNFKGTENYRNILFKYLTENNLPICCIVCGEEKVIDVHHIDEDKDNNNVNNLLVLCPTHHFSYHRYKTPEVMEKMLEHMDARPFYAG